MSDSRILHHPAVSPLVCSSCQTPLPTGKAGLPIGVGCESCGAPFCWECCEERHLVTDVVTYFAETLLILDGYMTRAERTAFLRCGCQS